MILKLTFILNHLGKIILAGMKADRKIARFLCSKACNDSSCGLFSGGKSLPATDVSRPLASDDIYRSWFESRLSSSVPRAPVFDPLSRSNPIDPEREIELDQMSMCGLQTNELPEAILDKIRVLLENFGFKGDLERFGKYMVSRYRSRSCAETPRALPSALVPAKSMKVSKTPLERILKSKGFAELKGALPDLFSEQAVHEIEGDLAQTALSESEDAKHQQFQMFYSPGTAVTYLAHRFPGTFAANFRVLTEVLKRVPDFNPSKVLDYGSGPGVSVLAALQIWKSVSQIVCVEPSENMQKVGKYMLSDVECDAIDWRSSLWSGSGEKFDLVIASYVLMEIRDSESRDLLVKNLFSRVAPGGVLVILDCGTPTGFRFLHRIREQFIIGGEKDECHIVAPCSHEKACPLALTGRDWCHFDQGVRRLPHYLYNKGSRKNNVDYEKFSYLVIRKGVESPRKKYMHESLAPTSWEKSYFWPRLVMPAIKAGGHTLMDVCSPNGQFERLMVSKSKPHQFGFRSSRKVMWGDLWRYPRRLARKEARESYTPEQIKEHMDKLRDAAAKSVDSNPKGRELDEVFYGQ